MPDPTPDQRCYVRHAITGDRGYLVWRDGEQRVRLDRPQEVVLPRTSDWHDDDDAAMFTLHQVARIAYAADRQLLSSVGQHKDARTEWLDMKEAARIAWVEKGPASEKGAVHPLRPILWKAVMEVLGGFAK